MQLDKHQLAALCSCFVQAEKSNEQVKLKDKPELAEPLRMLQESARRIAEVEVGTYSFFGTGNS